MSQIASRQRRILGHFEAREGARIWAKCVLGILIIASLTVLGACALLHERAVVRFSEERLAHARALRAEQRAPAAYQRFESARKRAESAAADSAAQSDYVSEARLWLEVAVAQAETVALSEQRLVLERENAKLDANFLAERAAESAREDARDLAAAAEIARQEAERALARAALAPAQRIKLSAEDVKRAALALLRRTELIVLALPPELEASGSELTQLVQEARGALPKAPDQALTLADRALFRGLSVLGALRRGQSEASPESKASLLEALGLLGGTTTRSERGLGVSFGAAEAQNARLLERLCSLIAAYPVGPVQLLFPGRVAPHEAWRKAAQPSCDETRVSLGADPASKVLSVVFVAY
jgi:hypothetical protein